MSFFLNANMDMNYMNTTYPYDDDYSSLTTLDIICIFLQAMKIAVIGVSLSFFIVGNFMNDNDRYDEKDKAQEEDDVYENKYYDELNKLAHKPLDKDSLHELRYKITRESTPKGDVIMTYNSDTETFWYYCDSKDSLKFNILDAIARKFTVENDCKCICVNARHEFYKTFHKAEYYAVMKQLRSNHIKKHGGGMSNIKSVYAKFKTYNTTKDNDSESKTAIPKHLTNRFSYKGKLNDYKPFEDKEKEEEERKEVARKRIENEHIDFAEFKKIQQEKLQQAKDRQQREKQTQETVAPEEVKKDQ